MLSELLIYNDCIVLFYISDDMYGHYVSSAGYSYHPPMAPILSVADMIPPPPPPPGEGPLEGMVPVSSWLCRVVTGKKSPNRE